MSTGFKIPENKAQILANRKRFIEALINEDQDVQCFGQMFIDIVPGDGQASKEQRCALGVAAKLFLGLNNEADYTRYICQGDGRDVYTETARMLDLDDHGFRIWTLNDDEKLPFASIGTTLRNEWGINE
jgi:hypothetical protein